MFDHLSHRESRGIELLLWPEADPGLTAVVIRKHCTRSESLSKCFQGIKFFKVLTNLPYQPSRRQGYGDCNEYHGRFPASLRLCEIVLLLDKASNKTEIITHSFRANARHSADVKVSQTLES